jgi:hypothetical protein
MPMLHGTICAADAPADIPSPPLDLRAEAPAEPSAQGRPNVAEEVLSAAKSVFHSVLPR